MYTCMHIHIILHTVSHSASLAGIINSQFSLLYNFIKIFLNLQFSAVTNVQYSTDILSVLSYSTDTVSYTLNFVPEVL